MKKILPAVFALVVCASVIFTVACSSDSSDSSGSPNSAVVGTWKLIDSADSFDDVNPPILVINYDSTFVIRDFQGSGGATFGTWYATGNTIVLSASGTNLTGNFQGNIMTISYPDGDYATFQKMY